MNGSLTLKIFLSVSLGLHLLLLSVLTLLYPDFRINHFPFLNIEVTLLPLVPETRAASNPITKLESKNESHESLRRAELPDSDPPAEELVRRTDVQAQITIQEQRDWPQEEKKEEPLIKEEQIPESLPIQYEVKVNAPASDPQPATPENKKQEMVYRVEEKIEKENSSIVILQSKVSHGNPLLSTDKPPSTSEDDILPKAIKRVSPIYPRLAKDKGYQGEVILRVQLLSDGRVGEIKVKKSSGHEILDRSAIAAVKQCEFIPGRERNIPIWYWVNIPIKFQLQ